MNIKDLLENKGILDEKNSEKTKVLEVESLKNIGDGKITIRNIGDDEYDAIEKSVIEEIKAIGKGNIDYEINKNAVYRAVVEPDLRDKELQKQLDCKFNPIGIVRKLFSRAEVDMISSEIGKLSGMQQSKDLIKEVKNS